MGLDVVWFVFFLFVKKCIPALFLSFQCFKVALKKVLFCLMCYIDSLFICYKMPELTYSLFLAITRFLP